MPSTENGAVYLRVRLASALLVMLSSGTLAQYSSPLSFDVVYGSSNSRTPAILHVPANASLVAAASEFCFSQSVDGDPQECAYRLSEALWNRAGQMTGEEAPGTATSATELLGEARRSGMEEASFATRRTHRLREFQEGRGALVFAHLKKCGGMTVQREVLSSLGHPLTHVPEDARWFFNHDDTAMSVWQREFSSARVVADHVPYGFHVLLAPRPAVYITVLREPKSRIYSYYRYLRVASDWEHPCEVVQEDGSKVSSMCKNNWWPEGLPRNASVRAWLERQLGDRHYLRTHVDNYQTRMLCGALGMKQLSPADEDLFLCARQNLLNHFEVVGLSERMDESACLMNAVLKGDAAGSGSIDGEASLSRVNSNAPESSGGPGVDEVPDFYVRWDRELYRVAESLLEERLRDHPHCRRQTAFNSSAEPVR